MVLQTLGLQLLLTVLSAVLGAGVLLWLQTIYKRVKLLRGLEEEIQQNLYTVGRAGSQIYEQQNPRIATRHEFYNNIYRAIMVDSPILYTRLVKGLSPIPHTYRDIAKFRSLGGMTQPIKSTESFLKSLESLEDGLIESGKRVKEIQHESLLYRLYSRFWLKEGIGQSLGMFSTLEVDDEGLKEKSWRPSGQSSNEKREEYESQDS